MKTIEELEAILETVTHQLADQINETTRVRLEARREIEALIDERDELLVRVANQEAELRATREAYIDAKWTNAYRRGAEAMREACANCVKHLSHEDGLGMGSQRLEGAIRSLPIPEEP